MFFFIHTFLYPFSERCPLTTVRGRALTQVGSAMSLLCGVVPTRNPDPRQLAPLKQRAASYNGAWEQIASKPIVVPFFPHKQCLATRKV